jgi:ribosomal protein S30
MRNQTPLIPAVQRFSERGREREEEKKESERER